MNRHEFIVSVSSAVAAASVGSSTIQPNVAGTSPVRVTRVAWIPQEDGGMLVDLAFEYAFPGQAAVWIADIGVAESENAILGTRPWAGVCRYQTSASYVEFRPPPKANGAPSDVLLARIDLAQYHAYYEQQRVNSRDTLSDAQQAILGGRIAYALGMDEEAVRWFGDPSLEVDPSVYGRSEARLFYAYALENLTFYGSALESYSAIADATTGYDTPTILQARVGRARILRILGNLDGAIADYQWVDTTVAQISSGFGTPIFARAVMLGAASAARQNDGASRQAASDASFGKIATVLQKSFRQNRGLRFQRYTFDESAPPSYRAAYEPGKAENQRAAIRLDRCSVSTVPNDFDTQSVANFFQASHFLKFKVIPQTRTFGAFSAFWTKISVNEIRGAVARCSMNFIRIENTLVAAFDVQYKPVGSDTFNPVDDVQQQIRAPLADAVTDFQQDILAVIEGLNKR